MRVPLGQSVGSSGLLAAPLGLPWVFSPVPRDCKKAGLGPGCPSGPSVPWDSLALGQPSCNPLAQGKNPWKIPWSNQLALGTHWLTLGHPSSGSDYTLGHSKDALVPSLGVSFYWLSLSFLHSFTQTDFSVRKWSPTFIFKHSLPLVTILPPGRQVENRFCTVLYRFLHLLSQ